MKRNTKRYLAAVLAATLLFTDCTEGFAAQTYQGNFTDSMEGVGEITPEETAGEAASETSAPEEAPQVLFELEELRTQSGKQYRLSDGSILAAGYGMDIHYEDEEGEWQEIDNRFLYEAAEDGEDFDGYTTADGAVEFKFAPAVQDGEILRVTRGDYFVGFGMLPMTVPEDAETAEAPAELSEDEATEGSGEEMPGEEIQPELERPSVTVDEPEAFEEQEETVYETEALNEPSEKPEEIQEEPEKVTEIPEQEAEVRKEAPATELSPAPLLFLKGEILNAEEVPAQLQELSAQAKSADSGQAAAFSLKGIVQTEALQETQDLSDAENVMEEAPEVVWAETGSAVPEEEETELLEAMKMDKAVTSVGYGNVLPGVSLQYVLSGSSLKEYILVNQVQDSYSYDFQLKLENLEPQMQEDGSILLNDAETGEAVYEIPAAYMTDAAGESSDAVEMEISETEDGTSILKVTADAQWINAKERVFPVQIDPTLNDLLDSLTDIRGSYVAEGKPTTSNVQYGNLMVGYDSSGSKQLRTYIQLRNLPQLPENSIICGALCHFAVVNFSQAGHPTLNISAKSVGDTWWNDTFTWNEKPDTNKNVMDYRTITADSPGTYVGWNITELVRKHYEEGNTGISSFALEAYDGQSMKNSSCAKAALSLLYAEVYPVLQIQYRDTKGIEGYYTYQTQDIGNAGTGYIGDFTSQLTLVKPIASYESTIQSYGLSLIYNSAWGTRYFINADNCIHSRNFTNMKIGAGWKLSAQETVTKAKLEDMDGAAIWLVYNDSDGTEHYFRRSTENSNLYEDEDGLNLTIETSEEAVIPDYTMKDKKGNVKFFEAGYLTKITDANGNMIHIIYNNGTAAQNKVSRDGVNRITAVYSQPKGKTAEKIFTLSYGEGNVLTGITETYGRSFKLEYDIKSDIYYLKSISSAAGTGGTYAVNAKYSYHPTHGRLKYVLDAESSRGMVYGYEKSATGWRVNQFFEYAVNETNKGAVVKSTAEGPGKTTYRDSGKDRTIDNADDILTTCLFNNSGQTVNMSSRDLSGNLLGVTASAYEASSGTSGKNNRISAVVSSGQAGVNLLSNGGFERYGQINGRQMALGWQPYILNGSIACTTQTPHHSGSAHFNLYNTGTDGTQMIYQSVSLVKNKTYTASVYVNTTGAASFASGGGAFLRIKSASGNQVVNGTVLSYKTDPGIDGGWQRISVTMTASESGNYSICLMWDKAKGTLRADDMQLEMAEAPSGFNHVDNGGFEVNESSWRDNTEWGKTVSGKAFHGNNSFYADGAPERPVHTEQTIQLNKSSNTTFLLSGWSKADSVPDLDETGEKETNRFWGLNLELTYSDGTTETHALRFNEFVHEWQYAAMAVTPKKENQTVATAVLRVCYYNNCNEAWFDNISLIEEPAQTYKYDKDGNLISVKSGSEGKKETYTYKAGTQDLENLATAGSGVYTFSYNSAHQPITAKNDKSTMTVSYDGSGQATKTILKNDEGNLQMKSTALYENGLLISQRDQTGAKSVYTYDAKRRLTASKNAAGQTIETSYDDTWNRATRTYETGGLSIGYGYTAGDLSSITREKYSAAGNSSESQSYSFTYDQFGNRTSVSVGNTRLADYVYNANNGTLKKMTYGIAAAPVEAVIYTYDKLDRVTKAVYYNSKNSIDATYGYQYSSDGSLSGITVDGKLKYAYQYDSLGRLIDSTKLDGGKIILHTQHLYDTSDRITSQKWQIGSDAFSESYTYNNSNGTLTSMKIGSEALTFEYNQLKQLRKRATSHMDTAYTYRTWVDSGSTYTTNQVASIQYVEHGSGGATKLLPTLGYTYDSIGNITEIKSGRATAAQYTYDRQNRLTKEVLTGENGSEYTGAFTYDIYGNILKRVLNNTNDLEETFTYEYGNSSWKDQLTKVTSDSAGKTVSRALTYDAIGNPLSYYNGKTAWAFTWKMGKQLATAESGKVKVTNSYDVDGIRDGKTVELTASDGTVTKTTREYVTLDGKIVRETIGNLTVDYLYDNEGRPYQITVRDDKRSDTGYYALNQQGDVIALVDGDGTPLVKYSYDAWGRLLSYELKETTVKVARLYKYNALQYRSYYYDSDLLMYDLGSRFYDPVLGRFISADTPDILGVQNNLYDKNLYAYCDNNPVMRVDHAGEFWEAVGIGFVAGVIGQYAGDVIGNIRAGKSGLDILTPTSSGRDYLASGIGGAIAAIPSFGFGGTMAVGAAGNIVSDSIKGKIKSFGDFIESAAWGAGANGLGFIASKGVAALKVKQINNLTRASQKNYLNTKIYKGSRANINTNYHSYMSQNIRGKIKIIENSFRGFKSGIYSTVTSTLAGILR